MNQAKLSGLSEGEICSLVDELSVLPGALVQRVWSPGEGVVVLGLRLRGENLLLLIAAEPPLTRLHLVQERPRPEGEPHVFQFPLRAELEGLRLSAIGKRPGDRVVELSFVGRHHRKLVAELTGRGANLYLLDEEGRILHLARRPRGSGAAKVEGPEGGAAPRRDNRPGELYQPPAPPPAKAPSSRFTGLPARDEENPFPFNAAVEAHFGPLEQVRAVEEKRAEVLRPLRRSLARLDRALLRLDEEAKRALEAGTYRRHGELLKAALHQVKRGASEVRVTDWYAEGQPETLVPLCEELSPKENMDRYFRLARRLGSATARVEERKAELSARRPVVAALVDAVESAEDEAALEEAVRIGIHMGLFPALDPQEKEGEKAERRPYRRFVSAGGRPILVGKGSVDNDVLTFKVARGNDVWIHVRGVPGSHVVVPTAGLGDPDDQTLLDAATLAAHFSRVRGETLVDVAWTHRKHVRKPKGARPGLVTVSQERGLLLRLEPERLARLLAGDSVSEPTER